MESKNNRFVRKSTKEQSLRPVKAMPDEAIKKSFAIKTNSRTPTIPPTKSQADGSERSIAELSQKNPFMKPENFNMYNSVNNTNKQKSGSYQIKSGKPLSRGGNFETNKSDRIIMKESSAPKNNTMSDKDKARRIKELLEKKKSLMEKMKGFSSEADKRQLRLKTIEEEISYRNEQISFFNEKIEAEKKKEEEIKSELAQVNEANNTLRGRIAEVESDIDREKERIRNMNLDGRVNRITERHENQENIQGNISGMTQNLPGMIRIPIGTMGRGGNGPTLGQMMPLIMGAGRIETQLNMLAESLNATINAHPGQPTCLTKEEIEKLPTKFWKPDQKSENETLEGCPICYTDYEPGHKINHLKCNHAFHVDCLKLWVEKSRNCPVCKAEIQID